MYLLSMLIWTFCVVHPNIFLPWAYPALNSWVRHCLSPAATMVRYILTSYFLKKRSKTNILGKTDLTIDLAIFIFRLTSCDLRGCDYLTEGRYIRSSWMILLVSPLKKEPVGLKFTSCPFVSWMPWWRQIWHVTKKHSTVGLI